jgi:hypothetical protein
MKKLKDVFAEWCRANRYEAGNVEERAEDLSQIIICVIDLARA